MASSGRPVIEGDSDSSSSSDGAPEPARPPRSFSTGEDDELEAALVNTQLKSAASWSKNVHSLAGFRSPLAASTHIEKKKGRAAKLAESHARQAHAFTEAARALGASPDGPSGAATSGGSQPVAAAPPLGTAFASEAILGGSGERADDAEATGRLDSTADSSATDPAAGHAPAGGACADDEDEAASGAVSSAGASPPSLSKSPRSTHHAASLPLLLTAAASNLQQREALLTRREEALNAQESGVKAASARQRLVLQLRAQVEQRERMVADLQARLTATLATVETAIHDAVAEERRKLLGMVDAASGTLSVLQGELAQREKAVAAGESVLAARIAAAEAAFAEKTAIAEAVQAARHAAAERALAERIAAAEKALADRVAATEAVLAERVARAEVAAAGRLADAESFDRQARLDIAAQLAALEAREAELAAQRVEAGGARAAAAMGVGAAAGSPFVGGSSSAGRPSFGGPSLSGVSLSPVSPQFSSQLDALAFKYGSGGDFGSTAGNLAVPTDAPALLPSPQTLTQTKSQRGSPYSTLMPAGGSPASAHGAPRFSSYSLRPMRAPPSAHTAGSAASFLTGLSSAAGVSALLAEHAGSASASGRASGRASGSAGAPSLAEVSKV